MEKIVECDYCGQKIRIQYNNRKLIVRCRTCMSRFLFPEDKKGTFLLRAEDRIDLMKPVEFETFIAALFSKLGYDTKTTKSSGDQGIDVIAERDDIRIGIQCKHYNSSVGNTAVQEALAGKAFYKLDKVFVVTNSSFTSSAIDLAKSTNVAIWDREKLMKKCEEVLDFSK